MTRVRIVVINLSTYQSINQSRIPIHVKKTREAYLQFLSQQIRDDGGETGEERREKHAHVPHVDTEVQRVEDVMKRRCGHHQSWWGKTFQKSGICLRLKWSFAKKRKAKWLSKVWIRFCEGVITCPLGLRGLIVNLANQISYNQSINQSTTWIEWLMWIQFNIQKIQRRNWL